MFIKKVHQLCSGFQLAFSIMEVKNRGSRCTLFGIPSFTRSEGGSRSTCTWTKILFCCRSCSWPKQGLEGWTETPRSRKWTVTSGRLGVFSPHLYDGTTSRLLQCQQWTTVVLLVWYLLPMSTNVPPQRSKRSNTTEDVALITQDDRDSERTKKVKRRQAEKWVARVRSVNFCMELLPDGDSNNDHEQHNKVCFANSCSYYATVHTSSQKKRETKVRLLAKKNVIIHVVKWCGRSKY